MRKVAILGATGMLGSTLAGFFSRQDDFEVVATARRTADIAALERQYPRTTWRYLDAETCTSDDIAKATAGASWVINAIGIIKQKIIDSDDKIAEQAIRVNALLPFLLAKAAIPGGYKIIQIATDCVYSGSAAGSYAENAAHDCHDVYGKSKSLGEVHAPSVCNLRCSIVGPEPSSSLSLLNWFLSQPRHASVNGFVNHYWNGITALHFAKICMGVIRTDMNVRNCQHVIPAGDISKEDLLRLFAEAFGRDDMTIVPVDASTSINRILTTDNPSLNDALWSTAGYSRPPSIADMIFELAEYMKHAHTPAAAHGRMIVGR